MANFFTVTETQKELADIALHGISRVGFGIPAVMDMVGIPVAETDMSRSVGLGQILPVDIVR